MSTVPEPTATTRPAAESEPLADPEPAASDIPTQVIEAFLAELPGKGVSAEVVARLRATLLEEGDFSDKGLRAALAPEETLP